MEDKLEKGLDVHRRRSDLEVKAELAIALRKVVNKTFHKKGFDDNFTAEELEKIKEIDTFLRMVSQHKKDVFIDDRKKYIFICCKSKYVRKDGTEISVFVNRPIDQDDFDYKKIDMFIAKCFYRLSQNRHIEVYFGVNSFKGIVREGKFRIERKQDNVVSSCCLFTDIDLPRELQELSDEEILSMIKEDFTELFINVPPSIICRSGGGIHIYFCFEESFYLENEEQQEEYRCALKILQLLFESYGGDPAVVDRSRILRSPHSYNRKSKYGKQGKEVSILEFNDITYDFVQLKKDLEFLLEGGMEGLQEDVLDDIFMDYDYSYYIEESDEAETIQEKKEPQVRKRERKELTAIQRMIDFQYKGIQPYYDFNNESHYLTRDLMIWLQNRNNHEGKRHKILFFFHYTWYVFYGIRTEEKLMERTYKLNTYFKPMLDNYELEDLVKYNIRYLNATEHKPRNIRNTLVQRELHFMDEELIATQGIYCDTYTEYEEKRRIKGNQKDYERYIRIREEQGKRPRGEEKQKNLEIIKQNPLISYREFYELTGLSKSTFDDYKKSLNYDREFRKQLVREKWLQPFKDTPNISCSEYCERMNCSKKTFEKYRAMFNKL